MDHQDTVSPTLDNKEHLLHQTGPRGPSSIVYFLFCNFYLSASVVSIDWNIPGTNQEFQEGFYAKDDLLVLQVFAVFRDVGDLCVYSGDEQQWALKQNVKCNALETNHVISSQSPGTPPPTH